MKKIFMKLKVGPGRDSSEAVALGSLDLEIAWETVEVATGVEGARPAMEPIEVEVLPAKPFAASGT